MTTDDALIDRVAKRIADRIYRAGWDQLPEADRHSTRVLARLAIDDVHAAEEDA